MYKGEAVLLSDSELLGKLRPYLLTFFWHFTKYIANPNLSRINVSKKSTRLNLLSSSLASILFAIPLHATTPEDVSKSHLSAAIDLLDDVASCIASGPATQNYRTLVRTDVDKIKADLLAAQEEIDKIAEDLDDALVAYKNIVLAALPLPQSTMASSLFPIPTLLRDATTLVLIDQSSVSLTDAVLANITRMVVVGRYNTGINYTKLTNLQSLRMFNGTMTDDLRNAISTLAKGTDNKLRYLEIPQWGTTIADHAFARTNVSGSGEKSIQELVGFEDVTTVGFCAFFYCANLKSVSLPNVTTFAFDDSINANSYAFYYCIGLTSISLPLLSNTGGWAFAHCTGLTTLSLPNVRTIGYCAFAYNLLKDITLSDNLSSVETNAFYDTNNVTTLRLVGHNTSGNDISGCNTKLAGTNINGKIINFYYILGEELRGSSTLTAYINAVLNISRSNFTLFNLSYTCYGYLVLSGLANRTSFSVSSGGLIKTIQD